MLTWILDCYLGQCINPSTGMYQGNHSSNCESKDFSVLKGILKIHLAGTTVWGRQTTLSISSSITQHTQCVFTFKADYLLHFRSGTFKEFDLLMVPQVHHFYFHLFAHLISFHLVSSFFFFLRKKGIFSPYALAQPQYMDRRYLRWHFTSMLHYQLLKVNNPEEYPLFLLSMSIVGGVLLQSLRGV